MLATGPGLDEPNLGAIGIERDAGRAIARLSGGEVSVLVELDRNRLAECRQHLGLEIQTDDVGGAGDDFGHRLAGCVRRRDVGDAGAGVGQ